MARKFVDMRLTTEEKIENSYPQPISQMNDYPSGLCISLDEHVMDRLDLSDDVEVGDMIDLRMLGRVTCVNKTQADGKSKCRVEIQGEQIALENEDTELLGEDKEEQAPRKSVQRRRYEEAAD